MLHFTEHVATFPSWDLKKNLYRQSQYSNEGDSKFLALIAHVVTAFFMNPKIGGSSPPQVETFFGYKTSTLSQEHPFVSRKWMLLPAHSYYLKCQLNYKYIHAEI